MFEMLRRINITYNIKENNFANKVFELLNNNYCYLEKHILQFK